MQLMRTAYLYPEVGDRLSPDQWREQNNPAVLNRAKERVKQVLKEHFPSHIGPEVEALVRETFPIKLAPEQGSDGG